MVYGNSQSSKRYLSEVRKNVLFSSIPTVICYWSDNKAHFIQHSTKSNSNKSGIFNKKKKWSHRNEKRKRDFKFKIEFAEIPIP